MIKVICSTAAEVTTQNIVNQASCILPVRSEMFKVFTLIESVFLDSAAPQISSRFPGPPNS
jgi:hypothetical protein